MAEIWQSIRDMTVDNQSFVISFQWDDIIEAKHELKWKCNDPVI